MSKTRRTIVLELDALDFEAIQDAMAIRQRWRAMPDGDGNLAGRTIAEICRGWCEMLEFRHEPYGQRWEGEPER